VLWRSSPSGLPPEVQFAIGSQFEYLWQDAIESGKENCHEFLSAATRAHDSCAEIERDGRVIFSTLAFFFVTESDIS
jgi:hypothetical protein